MIFQKKMGINTMALDSTFWVAVSFFIFFGGLIYLKVPQKINEILNKLILDIKNEIKDQVDAKHLDIKKGQIKFDNVEFGYLVNEKKILNNINLDIPGEKMTALVGHSGAGKSTILNLIPRFYNVNNGEIKIDDQFHVEIIMTLTSPNCPVAESMPKEVEDKVGEVHGVKSSKVNIVFDPPWDKDMMSEEAKLDLGMI